jgi:hypothetical protein
MCDECGGQLQHKHPGIINSRGATGPRGPYDVLTQSKEEAFLRTQMALHAELRRLSRQAYDHSRPVDEYKWLSSPPQAAAVDTYPASATWLADYTMPVRIESIMYSLPVGITGATVQLGQVHIPLYAGGATTAQIVNSLPGLGIILDEVDQRMIWFQGAPTSGFSINLAGFALERDGDR